MKKIYFTFLSFIVIFEANAQFTLTAAANNPVVGDLNEYYRADTLYVNGGTSGTGQVWNYTTLNVAPSPTLITETYVPVSGTPYAASFPGANMAVMGSDNPGDYAYYNYSTTKADILGAANASYSATYSNPETLYTIPFTYGSSSVDNFSSTFTISGIPVTRTGNITTTGDGTGTLNLPNGKTFNNVLKIKIVQNINDTYTGYGSAYTVSTSYVWINSSSKFGLLSIGISQSTVTATSGSTVTVDKNVSINKSAHVGVKENALPEKEVSVYPNPTKNEVFLGFSMTDNNNCIATVYGIMGNVVKEVAFENLALGKQAKRIDLSGISSGVYFIKLSSSSFETTKKVIIE